MKCLGGGRLFQITCVTLLLWAFGCRKKESPAVNPGAVTSASADAPKEPVDPANSMLSYPEFKFGNMPYIAPRDFVPSARLARKSHNDPAYMEEWNRFTTLEDYKISGKTNANWDSLAIDTMATYSELRSLPINSGHAMELTQMVSKQAAEAVNAGCDDPLIRYLYVRYVVTQQDGMTSTQVAEKYTAVARAIEPSHYSPIRKLYAYLRAADAVSNADKKNLALSVDLKMGAVHHLIGALHDTMIPQREASDVCKQMWSICHNNKAVRDQIEEELIPALVKLWPKEAFTYLLKGELYKEKAWDARGRGYADSVTQAGFKKFEELLKVSEEALKKAWDLDKKDPAIPVTLMDVYLGLGSKPEMERWFQRAMEIDPSNMPAVQAKSFFLQPKWYGSEEEMIAFGRECVRNKKWKGAVPIMLSDTHEIICGFYDPSERAMYWKKPGVWDDLHASFERFFELNPEAAGARHNYARAAYQCGKYDAFLEQVALFPNTNYVYFGGKDQFDNMVKTASTRAAKK